MDILGALSASELSRRRETGILIPDEICDNLLDIFHDEFR